MATVQPPPAASSAAAPPKHELFVEEQLRHARRRIRNLDLLAASLGFLVGTLVYGLGMILLDRWLNLPSLIRQVALGVYVVGAAAYILFAMVRPLMRQINPYYAARKVEQFVPGAKNSVINWLDLRDRKLPPAIRGAVGQRAARDLGKADLDQALSGRRARWLGLADVLLVLALTAAIVVLTPKQFWSFLQRAFAPFMETTIATQTLLEIIKPEGGDAIVPLNQSIVFVVRATGTEPKPDQPNAIKVAFRYSQAEPVYQERPMIKDDDGNWVYRLPAFEVHNGVFYKVTGGDYATDEHQVQARPGPLATGFQVNYKYRPYVRRPDENTTDPNLQGLRGTEVILVVKTNRHVRDGRLVLIEGDNKPKDDLKPRAEAAVGPVPNERKVLVPGEGENQVLKAELVPEDPEAMRFQFRLEKSNLYRIRFTSVEGEMSGDSLPYTIKVLQDQPPQVEITEPGKDTELPVNGILWLSGSASDDYGLVDMKLHMKRKGDPAEYPVKSFREGKFRLDDGSYLKSIEYMDFAELDKLQRGADKASLLRPGDVLEYWLEATDNCDYPQANVGRSKVFQVTLTKATTEADKKEQKETAENDKKQNEEQQDKKRDQANQAQKDQQKAGEQKAPNQPQPQQAPPKEQQNPEQKKKDEQTKDQAQKAEDQIKKDEKGEGKQDQKNQKGENKPDPKQEPKGQDKGEGNKQDGKNPDKSPKGENKPDKGQGQDQKKGEQKSQPQQGDKPGQDKGQEKGDGNKPDKSQGQDTKPDKGKEQQQKGEGKPSPQQGGKAGEKKDEGKGSNKAGDGKEGGKGGDKAGQTKTDAKPDGQGQDQGQKPGEVKNEKPATPGEAKEEQAGAGKGQGKEPGGDKAGSTPPQQGTAKGNGQEKGVPGGKPGEPKQTPPDQAKGAGAGKGEGNGNQQSPTSGNSDQKKPGEDATKNDVDSLMKKLQGPDPQKREEAANELQQIANNARNEKVKEDAKEALKKAGFQEAKKEDKPPSNGEAKSGKGGKDGKEGEGKEGGQGNGQGAKQGEGKQGEGAAPGGNSKDPASGKEGANPGAGKGGNNPGGGKSGNDPADNPAGAGDSPDRPNPDDPDPEHLKKAGELQLKRFKDKITPEMMKKLGWSEKEKEAFLKSYKDMLDRQVREKEELAASQNGGTNRQTTPLQRRDPNAKGPKDELQNAGPVQAPPEFRNAYQEFTQDLSKIKRK